MSGYTMARSAIIATILCIVISLVDKAVDTFFYHQKNDTSIFTFLGL